MAEIDLARQVRAHLESLRAAGVLFVPRGEPLALPGPVPQAEQKAIPEPPADPLAVRRQELKVLAAEIEKCDRCEELFSTRTQTVFGVGLIDPDVAFIGEAPGGDEDRIGEPFVGKAGQLSPASSTAAASNARKSTSSTRPRRPPGAAGSGSANRQPTQQECENCRPFFDRQFDLVRPKHVVARRHRGEAPVEHVHRHHPPSGQGIPVPRCAADLHVPPSALLRDDTGKMKRDVWEDMKLLLRTMGREIPTVKRDG
ncbi:MAG: uracil-DNA glycosylase [Gemmataceae bacterium]